MEVYNTFPELRSMLDNAPLETLHASPHYVDLFAKSSTIKNRFEAAAAARAALGEPEAKPVVLDKTGLKTPGL